MRKKAKFSNGVEIVYDEKTGIAKLAQTSNLEQTQPLDVVNQQNDVEEGEDCLDIPRDESVGIKQTHPKEVKVYKYKYEMGDNGSDTDIVPRSSNDDGIGGKKVTFETEKADGYSSGNSDDYVQTLQDRPMPKPSGDPQNHAVVANENELMTRIAKLENALTEAKKQIKESSKALNEERLKREREKYARRIAQIEVEKGLANYSEAELEQVVEARLKYPVDILAHDLKRVESLPSVSASSNAIQKSANNTFKTGFEFNGGLQSSSAVNLFPTNVPDSFPQNTQELYMATSKRADRINSIAANLSQTGLGALFSDENIKDYEASKRRNY